MLVLDPVVVYLRSRTHRKDGFTLCQRAWKYFVQIIVSWEWVCTRGILVF